MSRSAVSTSPVVVVLAGRTAEQRWRGASSAGRGCRRRPTAAGRARPRGGSTVSGRPELGAPRALDARWRCHPSGRPRAATALRDVVPDVAVARCGERAHLDGALLAGQDHRHHLAARLVDLELHVEAVLRGDRAGCRGRSGGSSSSSMVTSESSQGPLARGSRRRPPASASSRRRRRRRRARPRPSCGGTSATSPRCRCAGLSEKPPVEPYPPAPRAEPGKSLDLDEPRLLDLLDDQLGDPVATREVDRRRAGRG